MSASNAIKSGMAVAMTAIQSTFANSGTRIFLLKRTENSSVFTSLGELTSGAFVEFDDNRRESGLLRYATTSSFADTWAQATHVGYGTGSSLEVFEFVTEEKDTIDPMGISPFWSGRMTKIANERYTV